MWIRSGSNSEDVMKVHISLSTCKASMESQSNPFVWSVASRTFYRQILSLLYRSFSLLKLPPPACPGTTCIYEDYNNPYKDPGTLTNQDFSMESKGTPGIFGSWLRLGCFTPPFEVVYHLTSPDEKLHPARILNAWNLIEETLVTNLRMKHHFSNYRP